MLFVSWPRVWTLSPSRTFFVFLPLQALLPSPACQDTASSGRGAASVPTRWESWNRSTRARGHHRSAQQPGEWRHIRERRQGGTAPGLWGPRARGPRNVLTAAQPCQYLQLVSQLLLSRSSFQ